MAREASMKIVKLGRRYRLGEAGFVYALRFSFEDARAKDLQTLLWKIAGSPYTIFHGSRRRDQEWGRFYAPKKDGKRILWLGFMSEAAITNILLRQ